MKNKKVDYLFKPKTPKMKTKTKSARQLFLQGRKLTAKQFSDKANKYLYKRVHDMEAQGFKFIRSEKSGMLVYELDTKRTPKKLLK